MRARYVKSTMIVFLTILFVSGCASKAPLIHPDLLIAEMPIKSEPTDEYGHSIQSLAVQLNEMTSSKCQSLEKQDELIFYTTQGKARLNFPPAYYQRCKNLELEKTR